MKGEHAPLRISFQRVRLRMAIAALLLISSILMTSCGAVTVPTASATLTATSTPTATATITPSPTFTVTPTFTPTLIPTPRLPLLASTSIPQPVAAISQENAGQMTQLARWGNGSVHALVYSPDGAMMAAGTSLGLYLYDSQSLEQILFEEIPESVGAVAYSPDGNFLAYSAGSQIYLWHTGQPILILEGNPCPPYWPDLPNNVINLDNVINLAFSPDGQTLISSTYTCICRWQVSDGVLLDNRGYLPIGDVTFSPEGEELVSRSGIISPDGQVVATVSDNGTIYLRRFSNDKLIRQLEKHTDAVISLAFARDGQTLASSSYDRTIRLWRVSDGSLLTTIKGQIATSLAFSPDGRALIFGSSDGSIGLWRISDGTFVQVVDGTGTYPLVFSPDGQILASGSANGAIRLWRVTDGTLLRSFEHSYGITSMIFSPDGALLAAGAGDNTIHVWRMSDGALLFTTKGTASLWGGVRYISSLAFSPDGRFLASGAEGDFVRVWNVSDGRLRLGLHAQYMGGYTGLIYSPDGQTLITYNEFGIKTWGTNGALLQEWRNSFCQYPEDIAFTLDGRMVACVDDINTVIWRIGDEAPLLTLGEYVTREEFEQYRKRSAAFSPDGTLLATGFYIGRIEILSMSGTLLQTLEGHRDRVSDIAFSPDGMLLASISADGTVRLWCILPWVP